MSVVPDSQDILMREPDPLPIITPPLIPNSSLNKDVLMREPDPLVVLTPLIVTHSSLTNNVLMQKPDPLAGTTPPIVPTPNEPAIPPPAVHPVVPEVDMGPEPPAFPPPAVHPVVPEVDMGPEPPALPGNTHARRNPHLPIITARARYRKPKEKNGAQMTRLRRQMRVNKAQDLADDIRDLRQALDDALPAVAAKHNIALKELRRRVYNGAGIKTKRNLSVYNAKVACVMEIANEGLMLGDRFNMTEIKQMIKKDPSLLTDVDPDHLEEMITKLEAQRLRTLAVISELVAGLYRRTGIVGFAFFTRGNFSDITAPLAIHSGGALGFCSEMLNREPEVINAMLELWQIQRVEGAITAPSVEKMHIVSAAMIKSGLVQVTGKSNCHEFRELCQVHRASEAHRTRRGPSGVPWKRLSKQSVTGDVRRIYKALKDGSMKWKKLRTEEDEEDEERRFNKLISKGLATAGKKRKVRDDLGATHRTQGRELESERRMGCRAAVARVTDDGEPSDNEDRPECTGQVKSTKAAATKPTKRPRPAALQAPPKPLPPSPPPRRPRAAASKSPRAAASKSTTKTTPTPGPASQVQAACQTVCQSKELPALRPDGGTLQHERQMRELMGGSEGGSDDRSDDDDEGEEQVVSTKRGPPAKSRRTAKEPGEQAVKKTKKRVNKHARDDSQDEDEQPSPRRPSLSWSCRGRGLLGMGRLMRLGEEGRPSRSKIMMRDQSARLYCDSTTWDLYLVPEVGKMVVKKQALFDPMMRIGDALMSNSEFKNDIQAEGSSEVPSPKWKQAREIRVLKDLATQESVSKYHFRDHSSADVHLTGRVLNHLQSRERENGRVSRPRWRNMTAGRGWWKGEGTAGENFAKSFQRSDSVRIIGKDDFAVVRSLASSLPCRPMSRAEVSTTATAPVHQEPSSASAPRPRHRWQLLRRSLFVGIKTWPLFGYRQHSSD
ncbi:hypothetical protein FB45DRAFT_1007233 [Roridomyces roridus]|uniref:Uncharacterized protein n=1 Tax=Roridomyces roridus TaxID=1738132 RepID=A0AAD7BG25_9AGAR|nr:hypothetical protein FB45DRAFT_1007233 [Roridomyces roridus]